MANIFIDAEFGDKYETRDGHTALFLRNTGNSENLFTVFYVQYWGIISVYSDTGRVTYIEHRYDIVKRISKQEK